MPNQEKPNIDQGKLKQAREILKAAGLNIRDYKHLDYKEILKMAGVPE